MLCDPAGGSVEPVSLPEPDEGRVVAEEVCWRAEPSGERADRHHLNTVAYFDGRLLVCGLGRKPPGSTEWRDRVLPGGEQVPPALAVPDRGLAVCESPRRRMLTSAGRVSAQLPGYARGLCLVDGKLYAGTSRGRRGNEPPSLLACVDGVGIVDGVCALCRLDPASLAVEHVLSLEPHGREVYDVLALPLPEP